ncbi:hypothetical protein B0H10DRAFT_2211633 [Mycena sp. CBHHK59/15]|nr:hypothetical protein B0H10DRAFT_2211633 [Mycena sp. CBHHK59/15]
MSLPQTFRSHRRYNSEPSTGVPNRKDKHTHIFAPIEKHWRMDGLDLSLDRELDISLDTDVSFAPIPIPLRINHLLNRRRRPTTEVFALSRAPEILLRGLTKEHTGHPKTRIGQPVLKLAAIKDRLNMLEAENEHLAHRIESYRTDAEMLSSSVTYFSSEYYAGLLTIRDLRSRSRQDAEIMNNQELQLCQLKKFVGLMVEIGLHEPVLKRAHESVLSGSNFDHVLVEAIRHAAVRPGSAWSGILSAAQDSMAQHGDDSKDQQEFDFNSSTASKSDTSSVFEERQTTVDDLLKSLRDGEVPSGRHQSASQRSRLPANRSPQRNQLKPVKSIRVRPVSGTARLGPTVVSPSAPLRPVLSNLDVNRNLQNRQSLQSPQELKDGQVLKVATQSTKSHETPASVCSAKTAEEPYRDPTTWTDTLTPRPSEGNNITFSTQQALTSLERILEDFSSRSMGSLGTTSDESQSESGCRTPAHAHPGPNHTPHVADVTPGHESPSSQIQVCVRPPTACSVAKNALRNEQRSDAVHDPPSQTPHSYFVPGEEDIDSEHGKPFPAARVACLSEWTLPQRNVRDSWESVEDGRVAIKWDSF